MKIETKERREDHWRRAALARVKTQCKYGMKIDLSEEITPLIVMKTATADKSEKGHSGQALALKIEWREHMEILPSLL